MPCQGARLAGDSVGTLRGDPGTEMGSLGTETRPRTGPVHVCTLGSCGTPNSQSAMLPMPVRGRGRGSSLGRGRVPEDQSRCMLDWVSRGYIYREREAVGSPGAGGSLRVNTKGPCQACIPAQGQSSIYSPRQASRELRRMEWKAWREKSLGIPPFPPAAKGVPHCADQRTKGQGEVCPCPPVC